jgi:hypothetical protein
MYDDRCNDEEAASDIGGEREGIQICYRELEKKILALVPY